MFRLRIATALALGTTIQVSELTNAVTGGTFATALPGGFSNASLTLTRGWRDPVPDGAHIEIFPPAGELRRGLAWEGQRRRVRYAGRDLVQLDASGYGLTLSDADVLQTAALKTTSEPQVAAASILEIAMGLAPLLRIGAQWGQPAIYHPLSSFDQRTLWQVAQQLGTESGYDWTVWDGREAQFIARAVPTTPDYLVPVEQVGQWELDDSSIWTRVSVSYTDTRTGLAAITPILIDHEAEALRGVARHTVVSGGTLDAAGAIAFGNTFLANSVTPTLRATIGPVRFLRSYLGEETPGYAVRAGQWVQVGGMGEERGTEVIVQTSVDWNTGAVTLQLGAPNLDIAGSLARLSSVTQSVRTATNANTLAKA